MPAAATPRKTFVATKEDSHGWYVADVKDQTLGRAATKIAAILRGKHKATFTPHEDTGDFVVIINADKIHLTGNKWDAKGYHDHSLFPGGMKDFSAKQLMERHPTEIVKRAVWGMLPKGPLGRRIRKKLKVYAGDKHPHDAQGCKTLSFAS
jgi:large subunit ribosomal protein L13